MLREPRLGDRGAEEAKRVTDAPQMQQPVPRVSEEEVERILDREFQPGDRADARSWLERYGSELHHRETARVRLAILKLAGGRLDKLRSFVETAIKDYRDVLAYAEYPAYFSEDPSIVNHPDRALRIMAADWRQYEVWRKGKDQ